MERLSMYQSNSENSWMISFGVQPVPIHWLNKLPTYIKRGTPDTRAILNPNNANAKSRRRFFLSYIDKALAENIMRVKDIMDFIYTAEKTEEIEIVDRTKTGDIISYRTISQCVLERKKANNIIEESVKEKIIKMHRARFSYREILNTVGCTPRYIDEVLDSIGVKIPLKDKKLKKSDK